MNSILRLTLCLFLGLQMISCSKDKEDNSNNVAIQTTPVTVLSHRSAKTGGAIGQSPSAVIQRGVCYSETPNPTVISNITKDGTGLGTFTSNLNQLKANTKYYLRAYMVNESGTHYGEEFSFTTQDYPTENIWWLNEKIYVINNQAIIPGFSWIPKESAFVGADEVTSEINLVTIKFKQKPEATKSYKIVNKEAKDLEDNECLILVSSAKAPYVATYIYVQETSHTFQVTVAGGKCTLNISGLELSNKDDIAQKVTFKAVLKEK